MHINVCLFQEMADGLARLKDMQAALDTLQEKEDAVVAKNVLEPSSDAEDTSSPPHGSSEVLRKFAEAFGKLANSRTIETLTSSTML